MDVIPILTLPIRAAMASDRERLVKALAQINAAGASVIIRTDAASGESLVSGTSAEHLQTILRKITDEHYIATETGEVRVRYLETIQEPSEAKAKYIRQTGGLGNYAHVMLRLTPSDQGTGIVFDDISQFDAIPGRLKHQSNVAFAKQLRPAFLRVTN
jgi:elongation factor G